MAEIIEVANVAYEARDRAQAEITSLKLQVRCRAGGRPGAAKRVKRRRP